MERPKPHELGEQPLVDDDDEEEEKLTRSFWLKQAAEKVSETPRSWYESYQRWRRRGSEEAAPGERAKDDETEAEHAVRSLGGPSVRGAEVVSPVPGEHDSNDVTSDEEHPERRAEEFPQASETGHIPVEAETFVFPASHSEEEPTQNDETALGNAAVTAEAIPRPATERAKSTSSPEEEPVTEPTAVDATPRGKASETDTPPIFRSGDVPPGETPPPAGGDAGSETPLPPADGGGEGGGPTPLLFIEGATLPGREAAAATRPEFVAPHRHGEPLAVAGLIGLGLEHHGRKKFQRKAEHFQEESKRVQDETRKAQEKLQAEQKALQRQLSNQRQAEATMIGGMATAPVDASPVGPVRAGTERPVPPRSASAEVPMTARNETLRPVVNAEKGRETQPAAANTAPALEKLQEIVNTPYKVGSAEVVLHEVEKAAEKNVALERLYDLRQELKDDPTAFHTPASGGMGGGNLPGSQAPSGVPQPTVPMLSPQQDPHQVIEPPKNLYKKAAVGGVWAAIALLIFFGILYLINR